MIHHPSSLCAVTCDPTSSRWPWSGRATAAGRVVTERLAAGLARHGVAVISGLARGIDAVAHRAALEAGGRTVAVLGCGLDVGYPPEHAALLEAIVRPGCGISE